MANEMPYYVEEEVIEYCPDCPDEELPERQDHYSYQQKYCTPHSRKRFGVYINVYSVTRHYGGSEEGGWWFNAGEPLESVHVPPERLNRVERIRKSLEKKWAHKKYGNIYSVNGGQTVETQLDNEFARSWPDKQPHYE